MAKAVYGQVCFGKSVLACGSRGLGSVDGEGGTASGRNGGRKLGENWMCSKSINCPNLPSKLVPSARLYFLELPQPPEMVSPHRPEVQICDPEGNRSQKTIMG